MKARIDASYVGTQGAWGSVYRPVMTKELTEYVSRYSTCKAYTQDQAK